MKSFLSIIAVLLIFHEASAQYCGNSGSGRCAIDTGVLNHPGLYPPPDSFPPFLNNFLTSTSIQFLSFDSIIFGAEILYVDSLTWDTIENLPSGLCWSTNKASNTYNPGEGGCINFSGLPCDSTGQYKLLTLVTVSIEGYLVETEGDPGGLLYFVRLENPGDTLVPVDTTQTDSMLFIPYGGSCQVLSPVAVNLGPGQTVCAGSIVMLAPSVSGGQPPYSFLWQSIGSSIICPTCQNPSVTVTENSTFMLKVTDASGTSGYDTINYAVTGTAYDFQITSTVPTVFCGPGSAILSANTNDSLHFQWIRNDNFLNGSVSNMLTITDSSGSYFLLYSETGGCTATSNIVNLSFFDTTTATLTAQGSDTICLGGMVLLQANTGNGLSYQWLLNDSNINYTNSFYPADEGGTYSVVITNALNCTDTSAALLIVASPNPPPTLIYTQFSSDTICNNAGTIALTGAMPAGGAYSGTGIVNSTFYPNSALTGTNLIIYSYTDSTGCANSIADTIVVLFCTNIPGLSPANSFSLYPNPTSGLFTLQSDQFKDELVQWAVYDIMGNLLISNVVHPNSGKIMISTNTIASGLYWVRCTFNGKQASAKFVKMER